MSDIKFFAKVEGGEELRKRLLSKPEEFLAAMQDELTRHGKAVTAEGAAKAPVLTGELAQSSLTKERVRRKQTSFTFLGIFTSAHAAAVHEGVFGGTRKDLPSFKWWSRIFDRRSGAILAAVEARLRALVERDT